jgi:nitrite reductase/ring-hydroxylating ferredoxin subunit
MSDDCRDHSRRAFLQTGGCLALTLAASGVLPRHLLAQPIGTATGSGSGAERSYPVPAADGVSIDHDAQVILVRSQGKAFAFALSCPHQNAAVKWLENDHRFQCTKHDSKYQPDGVYTAGRATRNMDRFGIRRDAGTLIVELDRLFHSDTDAAGWAAATVAL